MRSPKKSRLNGLVIKSTGSWYEVLQQESDKIIFCRLAGKLKLQKSNLTNPVSVGDLVTMEPENENSAIINAIQKRKNYIVRQSPKSKHQMHLIAANIDLAILVTTLMEPQFKQGFIDRFIMTTEPQDIPLLIVFNKADLYSNIELESYHNLKAIYETIGYKTILFSCITGLGLDELLNFMHGKISLFSGQSGVGKSSIINKIIPIANKKTSMISNYSGKGMHTTTFAEMIAIDKSSFIIDTPGIKTLSFNNLEILDVAHNFREFFSLSKSCKFGSNCTHREEPECEVLRAIEQGKISKYRYQNYINILDEVESQNYWERKKEV